MVWEVVPISSRLVIKRAHNSDNLTESGLSWIVVTDGIGSESTVSTESGSPVNKTSSVQTDLVLIGLIPSWVVWTLVSQPLQGHILVPLKPDGLWNDSLQGLSIIVFQLIFELIFLFLIIENTFESIGFTKSVGT